MSEQNANTQEENVQKLYEFVITEMKAGRDKSAIVDKLAKSGVEQEEAQKVINQIYDDIVAVVKSEKFTGDHLIGAVLGGVLTALLGGLLWGFIVISANYEIGYMAWGLGGIAGFAVVKCSGGRKGLVPQVIATVSSLAGILIGKYFTFHHFFVKEVEKLYGVDAANKFGFFSPETMKSFFNALSSMLSGHDALWVILAVVTAWSIPKAVGINIPDRN